MSFETVAAGKVVAFNYTLKNPIGDVIDSSEGQPMSYLHGAGNIVPGLENALAGKKVGESMQVVVAPAEGYGERIENAVHRIPRSEFPASVDVQVGMQFGAQGPDGEPVAVWVTFVDDQSVQIDFNHPLAGMALHFDVDIVSIRDATAEEQQHGHPHGPGGHHH